MEAPGNWDQLQRSAREIAPEASWMLDKQREWEGETSIVSPRFADAKTLVGALNAAGNEVLVEVRNLCDALVAAPVAEAQPGAKPLPASRVSAQRIIDLLEGATRPIGELIEDLKASEADGRLSMLLMAGMTGVFTATNMVADQLERDFAV